MTRKVLYFLIFLFLVTVAVFRWTDVAVVDIGKTIDYADEDTEALARQKLLEMGRACHNQNWDSVKMYEVDFQDEFFGFFGDFSHPYKERKVKLTAYFIPKVFDSRMYIGSGVDSGFTWGMQSWNTYTVDRNHVMLFEDNADISFWLSTYQYFFEFPLRIQNATALKYVGEKVIGGVPCEGVLASWNTTKPQADIDQYLIWINKASHRIARMDYTVRDAFRFMTASTVLSDYKEYQGIYVPTLIKISTNLSNGPLHEIKISDLKTNTMSPQKLRPDPSLRHIKGKK